MGDRTHNSIRNIVFGGINKLVILLAPFVTRTILIKTLGAEYLGISSLFQSVLSVLSLAELGVGSAMVYAMYQPIARDDKAQVAALLNLYRDVYRMIGCVILAAGLALMPVLPRLIHGSLPAGLNLYVVYLLSLANSVISYFFFAYKGSLLTALQRSDIYSNIGTAVSVLLYSAAISGLLLTRNYYLYAMLFPIATLVQNIVCSYVVDHRYGEYLGDNRVDQQTKASIFRNVTAIVGHRVGGVLSGSIDTLSISAFLGLSMVAVYGNYRYVANSLCTILCMLGDAMAASVGNSLVLENQEKNYSDFRIFHFMYMVVNGVCSACLISLYQHFINLWVGSEYLLDRNTVILFSVYFYIRNLRQIGLIYKDSAGLWRNDALKPYAESILNLILNLLLIRMLGVKGVLLASILSILLVAFPWECSVLFRNVFHRGCCSFFLRNAYYTVATVVSCCAGYYACSFLPDTGLSVFFAKGILCAAVSFGVLAVFFLPLPECRQALRFLRNALKKKPSA